MHQIFLDVWQQRQALYLSNIWSPAFVLHGVACCVALLYCITTFNAVDTVFFSVANGYIV